MRPHRKYFDLNNDNDVQAALDLLDDSDADFSDDNDIDDETWVPFNIFPEYPASDEDDNENATASAISQDDSSVAAPQTSRPIIISNILLNAAQPSSIRNVSLNTTQSCTSTSNTAKRRQLWKSAPFDCNDLPIASGCQNIALVKTPLEYFKNYFPESHYDDAIKFTKMYVMSTRGQEVRYQQADFKRFYGCAMIVGCLGFPKIRMYWSHECQIPAIYNSMSRDKFLQMRSDIHFADVSVPDPCNKLWRVQPVIDLVRNRSNNLATEIAQYSMDEQVIPFTERCPARQTIRSKPRPTGLKNLHTGQKSRSSGLKAIFFIAEDDWSAGSPNMNPYDYSLRSDTMLTYHHSSVFERNVAFHSTVPKQQVSTQLLGVDDPRAGRLITSSLERKGNGHAQCYQLPFELSQSTCVGGWLAVWSSLC
ncbi:piggyBac transposable element-derived protein 3-like [Bactrocera neohumeralis]|uniref:piggyBac transposable element-derived protein 3-like n=1 Tax=Bactrocera neohumeralis TaxID=98809 RepID=UPI0021664B46|nr:piggyBac transposable element-derived protein 3-like [Bactrocera neohumeralis]